MSNTVRPKSKLVPTTGRPTKLNDKVQETICDAIRRGHYIKDACALAFISHDTYNIWLRRAEDDKAKGESNPYTCFSDALKRAEAEFKDKHLVNIEEAAMRPQPGAWQASGWSLERRFPEQFGKRMEVKEEKTLTVRFLSELKQALAIEGDDDLALPVQADAKLLPESAPEN